MPDGPSDQRQVKSMCRLCSGNCGTVITIEREQVVQVRGDRDHLFSRGYACPRGLQVPEAMNNPDRILGPLKRARDGSFQPIDLETALDEIAISLREMIDQSGSHSIALFKGTQGYMNACAAQMWRDWMAAVGSPNYFTTNTIDQSSHLVTMFRMGSWDAGRHRMADSDVVLMVGTNPLLSLGAYTALSADPAKRLKDARRRGLKLIVIDPRKTETAMQADCHLQPVPGEDVTILAGIIRIILENGWYDRAFCNNFVSGLEELRAAVVPFTRDYVHERAGIGPDQLEAAAAMFARDSRRGTALIGTGGTMAPRSNLADHLVECLNAICGRYYREGETVPNPGVVVPERPIRAQVIPADRVWEKSGKSSTGHGEMVGERMSGILADEMLSTGGERVRALFVSAANPAVALPDQDKVIAGLKTLDLLVTIDPFMTATARLSHYIIPPKMFYERVDVAPGPDLDVYLNPFPFAQYLPAAVPPPSGSQLVEDWYVFWALAKRLNLPLSFAGVPLSFEREPTTDELLAILLRNARVPLEEIRRHPDGHIFDENPVRVLPAEEGSEHRLQLVPEDVLEEIKEVAAEPFGAPEALPFRLIVRRMRTLTNSFGRTMSETRKRWSSNPLYVHPLDLEELGLRDGARVRVDRGDRSIPADVSPDPSLRRGVVAMSHCWGMLPDDDYDSVGVSTARLVRTDAQVEKINAMPVMTAIPVRIVPMEG